MRRLSSGFGCFILSAIFIGAAPLAVYAMGDAGTVCNAGGCESSTSSLTYLPDGIEVSASGFASGSNPPMSWGNATGDFLFHLFGPKSESVPLIETFSGSTSASGSSSWAKVENSNGNSDEACSESGLPGYCGIPSSFSDSGTYPASAGFWGWVGLEVMGVSNFGAGSWSASEEITLEIDPTAPDASDFTLEIIGYSTAAAPEPSSLWLLGTGLLALLGTLKFRRLAT
jgi:hypothetical protein